MSSTQVAATATPDVSVVVIVYNDAERLPRAVGSVLRQSLRSTEVVIVDDRSRDDSFEVARQLAAEHPGRVRAFQLPENSGGCGAPRNRGVAETRGRYVMFLDSDDELDLDACRNMLEAAERSGADLVSGLSVRRYLDNRHGKTVDWYPWLYSRTQELDSIAELPDLLVWDTLSTNKCYRRDFLVGKGLQFPVGILYEDLLFSAQAYLAAERIALIPNRVYWWDVVEKTAAKSLSNRRHEISNFTNRLEIHRRIDRMLADRGLAELKSHKDVKFLKHDLVLHLRDLPFLPVEFRHEFAEHANGYLSTLPREAYDQVPHIQRICAYLLSHDDWDNLLPAIDTLINRDKLSEPLHEQDGRVYWCAEHLDDEEGRRVLDVTEAGYHAKPISRLFLRNRLTGYSVTPQGLLQLSGRIVNPLGAIAPNTPLTARLEFTARRRSLQSFSFVVQTVRHEGPEIAWQTTADLARRLRPIGVIDNVWDLRLVLNAGGTKTTTRVTVGDYDLEDAPGMPVRPRLSRLVADRLEPAITARGHLAFQLAAASPAARRTSDLIHRAVRGEAGTLARGAVRKAKAGVRGARQLKRTLNDGHTKLKVYEDVLLKLPVVKGQVVFESHLGKQYSDSPRAVYEELRRRGAPIKPVWAYAGSPEGFPEDAQLVKRWSWAYLRALAQAEFWIDNQGFPLRLRKRPETTYIQTWHGSALKKMGFDMPAFKKMSFAEQREYQQALDRFDHFLIRSEHDVRTLARAYRMGEERLLRTGYPRNDVLVQAHRAELADGERRKDEELMARLGIDPAKPVVLYAPTFRANAAGQVQGFELPFDPDAFAERFGDRLTLLVRCHYLNSVVLPPSVRGRVVNVSDIPDVTPLYLLADALVTDYSSVMFDYALLDRPMIFFAYDLEEYSQDTRGVYFDLVEKAPGPVVQDLDGLYTALDDLAGIADRHADARRQFVKEYGEYDQGDAAARIADRFFKESSS